MSRFIASTCLVLIMGPVVLAQAVALPGFRVGEWGRPAVVQRDLQTLAEALSLDGAQAKAAHEAIGTYENIIEASAVQQRAALLAIDMPVFEQEQVNEAGRRARILEVQQDLERRRKAGEFDADPAALRRAMQTAIDAYERADAAMPEGDLELVREVMGRQAAIVRAWNRHDAEAFEALESTLQDIAGPDRAQAYARWRMERAVRYGSRRARLAGERLDILDAVPQGSSSPEIEVALEAWLVRHVVLLQARNEALRSFPLRAARAVESGSFDSYRRAVRDVVERRAAVRDHALTGVDTIAVMVGEPEGSELAAALHRGAFPSVWRRGRADRAIRSVSSWNDLDSGTRAAIEGLMEDHQAADVQFRQLEQDMLVEEEPGTVMRGDLASARQWFPEAQPATSTTSNLKRVRDRRWALNIDTMDTLREIVGEDAWKRVPGTRTEPERD